MTIFYDMTEQKQRWLKLQKAVERLIVRAVPGSSPSAAQDRRDFMKALFDDFGRMKRLDTKHDGTTDGDKRVVQQLIDWSKLFKTNPASFKGPRAGTKTSPSASSSSPHPSSTTSSSTTAGWTEIRSKPRGSGKGKGGQDERMHERWSELVPADETPLLMPDTFTDAPRLDVNTTVEKATGYIFRNGRAAASIAWKFAETPNPLVVVMPRCSPADYDGIMVALEKIKEEANVSVFPIMKQAAMMVKDSDGSTRSVDVTLLNFDEINPILPSNIISTRSDPSFTTQLPDLEMELPSTVDIWVSILAPMCREVGIEDWWDKLKVRPMNILRDDIRTVITTPKYKPNTPYIRNNRTCPWRGEQVPDSRIQAIFRIPPEHVETLLAKSGRHGLIIDRLRKQEDDLARIRMPTDDTIADVNGKIDALPPQLKKMVLGVVPTLRGYAVRVKREDEAEFTRRLCPQVATELGPALGMQTTSSWRVHGIPREANRETIIKSLSSVAGGWHGWTVLPKRTLGAPRGDKVTWLVESDREPPRRSVAIRSIPITIDRYVEPHRVTSITSAWHKPPPRSPETAPALPRTKPLWSDVEDGDDMEEELDLRGDDHDGRLPVHNESEMTGDTIPKPVPKAEPRRQRMGPYAAAARQHDSGGPIGADGRRPMLLRREPAASPVDQRSGSQQLPAIGGQAGEIRRLEEESKKKDEMILSLNETIRRLTDQVENMQRMMVNLQATMQQQFQVPQQGAQQHGGTSQTTSPAEEAKPAS